MYGLFEEENEGDSSLVMELLGPSLEELFNRSNRLFVLPIVLILADQMVRFRSFIYVIDSADRGAPLSLFFTPGY